MTPLDLAALLEGKRYGEFEIGTEAGGGQFSKVFRATHLPTGRVVALKVLNPNADLDAAAEFGREGVLLEKLKASSGVVTIHGTGALPVEIDVGGVKYTLRLQFLSLELADVALESLLIKRSEIALVDRLRLWRGLVLGIHQMHLTQIVHRDLKSSNCLVFLEPRNVTLAKVSDLGRSRDLRVAEMHSPVDYIVGRGDLRFAPPEYLLYQGDDTGVGHRHSDVYGLGSVLFELVTGQGITSMALPDYRTILAGGLVDFTRGRRTELSSLRSSYRPAFAIFEDLLPLNIRRLGGDLIRVICSPVPEERWPASRLDGRRRPQAGLNWLLNRADIIIKNLTPLPSSRRRARALEGAQ